MRTASETFERIPLLSPDECADVVERVDELRDQWVRCHPSLPYFILGTSSFVAAREDPAGYERAAAATNAVIGTAFRDLLDRVRAVLEERESAAIADADHGALPGFHIFGFHPIFRVGIAGAHFDRLFRYLRWPIPVDAASSWSFTLPLELPVSGGGIDWWELTPEDLDGLDPSAAAEVVDAQDPLHVAHDCGTLVVHSGLVLHRIAPSAQITFGDRRITLQGHVISAGAARWWYW